MDLFGFGDFLILACHGDSSSLKYRSVEIQVEHVPTIEEAIPKFVLFVFSRLVILFACHPNDHWTLQSKGERTCMTQG